MIRCSLANALEGGESRLHGKDSRNEYLEVLRGKYLKAKTKKEKSLILGEYCRKEGTFPWNKIPK